MDGETRPAVSAEGKLSLALALLLGLGAGAMNVWPERAWIGLSTMALSGAGFGALGAYHFRASLGRLSASISRGYMTVIALALGASILLIDYWYYTNFSTNGGIWRLGIVHIAPPKPAGPPPAPPPEPKKPWVSDEEIEKALKNKKPLIPLSPEDLVRLRPYNGADPTEIYIGKWIKVSGRFTRFDKFTSDKKDYISITLDGVFKVYPLYDQKKWEDAIVTMRPDHIINTNCQIGRIDPGSVYLWNCESL